jgi:iron complex outermembrane receptor protein
LGGNHGFQQHTWLARSADRRRFGADPGDGRRGLRSRGARSPIRPSGGRRSRRCRGNRFPRQPGQRDQPQAQRLGVVDAIKAEDIAQFPDLNLAESLQRIPGVSISRINGEGRQITVRGLGSEYTRVRINGMEAISTTGGTANSGGTNRGRGFDFNVFASDLFNSIAVRKTASADVEEGSLGATVDLTTARAFDSRKPQLVLSAAPATTTSEKTTPRLSGLASRTFFDGKPGHPDLGRLRRAPPEGRRRQHHPLDLRRQQRRLQRGLDGAGLHLAQINNTNHDRHLRPAHPGLCQLRHQQQAPGVTGSIQYKPDATEMTLDALYAYLEGVRKEAQLQAIGLSRAGVGKPQTIIRDGTVVGKDLVQARWTMSICAPSRPMTS